MERLRGKGIACLIYEPTLNKDTFQGYQVVDELVKFKEMCDLIIANRWHEVLVDVCGKVYTCDVFGMD